MRAAVARQYRVGAMLLGANKMGAGPGPGVAWDAARGKERDPIESNQPGPRAERDPVSVVLCLATCRRSVVFQNRIGWQVVCCISYRPNLLLKRTYLGP